jgi:hypothetical protein
MLKMIKRLGSIVFNATFNNICVISWQSVLLVEESEVHGEHHRPATSHLQTLSHYAMKQIACESHVKIHVSSIIQFEIYMIPM